MSQVSDVAGKEIEVPMANKLITLDAKLSLYIFAQCCSEILSSLVV
jgi:hypothetical protein